MRYLRRPSPVVSRRRVAGRRGESPHYAGLALKAFLISQGVTENALRGIGHDLVKCLAAARVQDSFKQPPEYDLQVIDLLNPYYKGKEFEYLVPGATRFPQVDDLGQVAHRLLVTLRPIIWKAVHAHLDQSKTRPAPRNAT